MKRLLKTIYYVCGRVVFILELRRAVRKLGDDQKVYLVDIDNTLADTWPSLKDRIYHCENQRYQTLSIFIGMRKYVLETQKLHKVIFISARNYLAYGTTKRWLEECGIEGCKLILVPEAMEKIYFLLELIMLKKEVVFIDDLSYNHEHGEVKSYDLMLSILDQLPLTYLGINEIEIINSAHEAHHQGLKKTIPVFPDFGFH